MSDNKRVWISDICYKQIHVRKEISIRCNRIKRSDAPVSAKHNTQIPGPAIYTDNPDSQPPHSSIPLSKPPTHSPHTPPTPPQPKHRHASNTPPVPTGLVNPKPNPLTPWPPRTKHIHISHTPPTPHIPRTALIHNTSTALDTMPKPRVPPTCPALITPHPSPTPALPSTSHHNTISTDTHTTQTTVHASQSQQPPHAHRVPRQPHRQTKDNHMTTDTTQGHRPAVKVREISS